MFRRRRAADDEATTEVAAQDPVTDEPTVTEEQPAAPPARPEGPWDVEDAPEDEDEVGRLDLGGLRVAVLPGMEARVEMDQQSQQVVWATIVDGQSALQLSAFAAPKTSGIWDEVRAEIVQSLRADGGSAEEVQGPFGTELAAQLPGQAPGQGRALQPARFLGVDGPRWFLRGLLSGPAAADRQAAARLEDAFRRVVVDRGSDAMAPRDPLPLRLPREAAQALNEGEGDGPNIDPFERGPEISEVR